MPVEDVQYLLDNSVPETVQVFVDSSMRRREFHPRPSEYTLTFKEPISNVYGVEVLDASIPATSYNVDLHSNELLVYVLDEPASESSRGSGWPLDDVRLLTELGSTERTRAWLRRVVPSDVLLVDEADFEAAVASSFSASGLVCRPSHNALLGSRGIVLRGAAQSVRMYDSVASFRGSDDHVIVEHDGQEYALPSYESEAIARFRDDNKMLSVTHAGGNTWELRSLKVMEEEEGATRDTVKAYVEGGFPYQKLLSCRLRRMFPGDYDMETLRRQLTEMLEPERISVGGVDQVRLDLTRRLEFFSVQHSFCFAMHRSTMRSSMGFDELADLGEDAWYRGVDFGGDRGMFVSRYDETRRAWVLQAPGVVDLMGDGYVKLRCPEVESYMPSTGLDSDTGLAVFKLLGGNQQSNLRLDFNNVKRKPIHPIGKLSRITFRFERPDGQLYNFRGVNHTMLLGIQRWSPTREMKFRGSVLNPAYKPNLLDYKLAQYVEGGSDGDEKNTSASTTSSSSDGEGTEGAPNEEDYDYSTDGSYTSDEP